MTLPPSAWGVPFPAPQPGLFPLRPLRIGEILGGAVRVAVGQWRILVPPAFVITLVSAAAQIGVLAATGQLAAVADGSFSTGLPADATPAEISAELRQLLLYLLAATAAGVITQCLLPIVDGVAAPSVAHAMVSRVRAERPLARLRGRFGLLIGAAALSGVAIAGGWILLIVPGIILWVALAPIGPIAVMEGTGPRASFRRALRLTEGLRARIFGIRLLELLISGGVSLVAGSVILAAFPSTDTGSYLITSALSAVVGAATGAWSATVTAVIYVDLRLRREDLAGALLRSAQRSDDVGR